jgi:TPR repeat protein
VKRLVPIDSLSRILAPDFQESTGPLREQHGVSAMTKPREGSALAEGFYWMAEKLAWGYEDTEPDLVEAYKLFRQAGELGFSDALIRVGELQEHGKGTPRDPNAPVRSYIAAAKDGNFFAFAYLASALTQTDGSA